MRMAVLAIGIVLTACGAPQVVQLPPPEPKVQPSAAAGEPDAYLDFRGIHAKSGATFRLASKPMTVDGPNVVVTIVKVDWSTMTGPSGKDTREASVNLRVQKGAEERVVTLGQGDARTVLGATLTLVTAGEDYDKTRLSYEPWIDLRVDLPGTAAPIP
jgi:hypothetical protein